MRTKRRLIEKLIAACMVLLLAAPAARAEPLPGQEGATGQETQATSPTPAQQTPSAPDSSPNSAPIATAQKPGVEATSGGTPQPGAEAAQNEDQTVAQNAPASDSQSSSSQSSPDQQQNGAAQPVGTAAAPAVKGTGVAGSRVSGAAIAPAKQRRVRTFLISIGVVVAACVAVGAVVALTHATPSEPRQ
jgi:hypothetical protein